MRAAALLDELGRDGVVLETFNGDIVYRGPKGVMAAERLAALREHKVELLLLLTPDVAAPSAPEDSSGREPLPGAVDDDRPIVGHASAAPDARLAEWMGQHGYVPDPSGAGWALTPERLAMCVHHPDRPLSPGHKLYCPECRARIGQPVRAHGHDEDGVVPPAGSS